MAQKAWKKYLTEDEYNSLTPEGKTQAKYWAEYLPEMCAEMKADGTLYKRLSANGNRISEMRAQMASQGMPEWAAQEFVNEELYNPHPEK